MRTYIPFDLVPAYIKVILLAIPVISFIVIIYGLFTLPPDGPCTGVLQERGATLEYKPAPIELEVDLGAFNRR